MKDLKLLQFQFFIPDFNLLRCELENFSFELLYLTILKQYDIKTKSDHDILSISFEKIKLLLSLLH